MISLVSGVASGLLRVAGTRRPTCHRPAHPRLLRADFQTLLRPARRRPGLRSWRSPAPNSRCATVTANIPEIERQIGLKENEINTLLGRNPGPVARTSTLLAQEMPVEIPVGLPSTLLERRPDVRDGGAASPRGQRGNRRGRRRLLPAHRPDDLLRRRQHRPAQPVVNECKHLVGGGQRRRPVVHRRPIDRPLPPGQSRLRRSQAPVPGHRSQRLPRSVRCAHLPPPIRRGARRAS